MGSKHNVQDVEFVECPYCPKGNKNQFKMLHWKHLRNLHGKTIEDVKDEFPDIPTMTLKEYNKKINSAKIGSLESKKTHDKIKTIYCFYKDDDDCPGEPYEIANNQPNIWMCNTCRKLGKPEVDGKRKEHANDARTKTLMERYNVTNAHNVPGANEKILETYKKQGKEGIGFADKELAKRSEDTIEKKTGYRNFMQTEEGRELFRGDKSPTKRPEVRIKISKKLKGKLSKLKYRTYENIFGEEKAIKLKEKKREHLIKEFLKEFEILLDYFKVNFCDDEYKGALVWHNFQCQKCNYIFKQPWNSIQQGYKCPKCFPRNQGESIAEIEVREFICDLIGKDKVKNNCRNLIKNPETNHFLEIDIYIPSLKIAIEWHSEFNINFTGSDYHLNKTLECKEKGIYLIHIFEDEWIFKKEIVKSRLKQILRVNDSERIHARKCEIKEIEPKVKNEFLEKFHIQGKDASKIKLGAFYNEELVSVMTFGKGNISKGSKAIDKVWELNRFCSNSNYHIPGIAGKLLSHFKKNFEWKEIFSYADRRWSQGNLYYQLEFELDKITQPNYWYIKGVKRIHRFNLRKRSDEPKDITEKTLRLKEGYNIIWDCGSLKFSLKNM